MKDFWKELNKELGFVFVSGVPSENFISQINTMNSDLLHFVPSVSNDAAIGLAIGAFIAGFKSSVLLDNNDFSIMSEKISRFDSLLKVPLIIISNSKKNSLGIKQFKDCSGLNEYVYTKGNTAILTVR